MEELPRIAVNNAIDLAKFAYDTAVDWSPSGRLNFTPEMLLECGRLTVKGIYDCAGQWRDRFVHCDGYVPPSWRDVKAHVDEFCNYANSIEGQPLHSSAYVLWRIGWIHPFFDGNGRVARELSYLAFLVAHKEIEFPGSPVIPELIDQKYRDEYFAGLHEADFEWDGNTPRVEKLESLIAGLFVEQMASANYE